jgi:cytochrome c peroxidase
MRIGPALVGLAAALSFAQSPRGSTPIPADTLPAELAREVPFGLDRDAPLELDDAAAAIGRKLFFDPILSRDGSVACASCHDPARGFAGGEALSVGVGGARTERNTPTVLNRAFGRAFMWDGRAATLDEQVLLPIENPREMALALDEALARLAADPSYSRSFQTSFSTAPDRATLSRALSAFVRRQWTADSPVDHFRERAEFDALTNAERAGLWFYESRGRCWRCHSGPNFSDEAFHNTGIGARDGVPEEGRFAVTRSEADRGAFKTPTLRGCALTAPYMHDGSLATLDDVVAFYRRGGVTNAHLAPELAPIEMTDEDARNLVAFLRALSRPYAPGSTK